MPATQAETEFAAQLRQATDILRRYGATDVYVFGPVVDRDSRDFADVRFAVRNLPDGNVIDAMTDIALDLQRTVAISDADADDPFVRFLHEQRKLRPVEEYLG
ncbi:MAG TPA: hypothetical protein VGM37_18465 [Armatimonadota bacterium]|jgi:predicted nucleotidyltransferase